MGKKGLGISQYAIVLLSVTVLFVSAEQASAVIFLDNETREQVESIELYLQEQAFFAEQSRDKMFAIYDLKNPYLDEVPNYVVVVKVVNDNDFAKPINRFDDTFQLIKEEQLSLAEKKYKEILGGKEISNFAEKKPDHKITIYEFTIDEQTGFMNRNYDDFNNYKIEQILLAEEKRNQILDELSNLPNPYLNDESVEVLINNEDDVIEHDTIDRYDNEFHNLVLQQILLAEEKRDEILDFSITQLQNPYKNNEIIVNDIQPQIIEKSEPKVLKRDYESFQIYKAEQIKLAQIIMEEKYDFDNDENENKVTTENKVSKPVVLEREDNGFELLLNEENEKAKQKIFEILGGKTILNFDDVEVKIVSIPIIKTNSVNESVINDNEELQNKPIRDPNILCFGLGCSPVQNIPVETPQIQDAPIVNTQIQNKPIRDPNILCFGLGC